MKDIPVSYIEHALHTILREGRIVMDNGKCIGKRLITSTVVPPEWITSDKQILDQIQGDVFWSQLVNEPIELK